MTNSRLGPYPRPGSISGCMAWYEVPNSDSGKRLLFFAAGKELARVAIAMIGRLLMVGMLPSPSAGRAMVAELCYAVSLAPVGLPRQPPFLSLAYIFLIVSGSKAGNRTEGSDNDCVNWTGPGIVWIGIVVCVRVRVRACCVCVCGGMGGSTVPLPMLKSQLFPSLPPSLPPPPFCLERLDHGRRRGTDVPTHEVAGAIRRHSHR